MKILSDAVFDAMLANSVYQRDQIARLIEQVIELKRDGFARPTVQMAQEVVKPVDDRIMAAIRAMAPEGSRLEGELMAFANAALLAEKEIEDIADEILAGSSLGDDN